MTFSTRLERELLDVPGDYRFVLEDLLFRILGAHRVQFDERLASGHPAQTPMDKPSHAKRHQACGRAVNNQPSSLSTNAYCDEHPLAVPVDLLMLRHD